MSGKRIIEGMKEVLAIVEGKEEAARIWYQGHCYVLEARALAAEGLLKKAHDHMHRLCAIIPGNDAAYRINTELMAELRAALTHTGGENE